ncbi:MAG: hypothetical protein QOC97_485 [Chloroflexota bacterium]|nr:hypothetical protein [Chloroflexota bacterium]
MVARESGSGTAGVRPREASTVGAEAPSEDLLPSGGVPIVAPAPAPHRALALDALRIVRLLRDRRRVAGSWGEPAFAREVEAIRRQLAPLRDRRGLAASYGREAFRMPDARERRGPLPLDATPVAYAGRWLELGDGVARPGWIVLVTGPG